MEPVFEGGVSLFPLMTGRSIEGEELIEQKDSPGIWFLIGAGAVIALSVAVMVFWERLCWPGAAIATRIADALFISAALALTVDRFVKTRLLREVALDTSKYLIGYNLPSEVQGRIQELMSTSIIRSNWQQRYEVVVEGDGRIRLKGESVYTLENFSNIPQRYEHGVTFEVSEQAEVYEMGCLTSDEKVKYHHKNVRGEVDGNVVRFHGKSLMIPPRNPDMRRTSDLTYQLFMRYSVFPAENTDIIAFDGITRGITIIAQTPPGLEFFAYAIGVAPVRSGSRWEYANLFMPREHIRVGWRTVSAEATPDGA